MEQVWSKTHNPTAARWLSPHVLYPKPGRLHTSELSCVCTLTSRPRFQASPSRAVSCDPAEKLPCPHLCPQAGRPASHRQTRAAASSIFSSSLCIILASKINFPQTSGAPSGLGALCESPLQPLPPRRPRQSHQTQPGPLGCLWPGFRSSCSCPDWFLTPQCRGVCICGDTKLGICA